MLSQSVLAYRPHPPHSQAHRDFTVSAYTRCLRCAGAPRRPASGSGLSRLIPSWHATLYDPGELDIGRVQYWLDVDTGLRRVLNGSALPTLPQSASRGARNFGASCFTFAAACQVARPPLADLTKSSLATGGLYIQAFDGSVALAVAGHRYDSHWTPLSVGLAPTGMSASLAAPEPSVRNYRTRFFRHDSPHRPRDRRHRAAPPRRSGCVAELR